MDLSAFSNATIGAAGVTKDGLRLAAFVGDVDGLAFDRGGTGLDGGVGH
jgi:hypothetical protein